MSVFMYSKWLNLPLATKALLAKEFGFSKTGPTHVADNRIVQDGYKIQDVENAMDISAIKRYVGAKEAISYDDLWDMMIRKIEGGTIESPSEPATTTEPVTIGTPIEEPQIATMNGGTVAIVTPKPKRGRPKRMM